MNLRYCFLISTKIITSTTRTVTTIKPIPDPPDDELETLFNESLLCASAKKGEKITPKRIPTKYFILCYISLTTYVNKMIFQNIHSKSFRRGSFLSRQFRNKSCCFRQPGCCLVQMLNSGLAHYEAMAVSLCILYAPLLFDFCKFQLFLAFLRKKS